MATLASARYLPLVDTEGWAYRSLMPTELETQFTELIGSRVSIRLHDPEGGFRDILGHLLTPYTLRNKRGEIIEFSHSEIFVWKRVIEKV
jgi:hypothetical protein